MNQVDKTIPHKKVVPFGWLLAVVLALLVAAVVFKEPLSQRFPVVADKIERGLYKARHFVTEFPDSIHQTEFPSHSSKTNRGAGLTTVDLEFDPEPNDAELENLINNPICRSIYVSEYLPTFNVRAVEKCERYVAKHERNQLFGEYIQQICTNPLGHTLQRQQIAEIQLRLQKYASVFPQTEIHIDSEDIDGIYDDENCQIIATYQVLSNYPTVDGFAGPMISQDLTQAIPLSAEEIASITLSDEVIVAAQPLETDLPDDPVDATNKTELPTNPFQRIAFCLRNPEAEECKSAGSTLVAIESVEPEPIRFNNTVVPDSRPEPVRRTIQPAPKPKPVEVAVARPEPATVPVLAPQLNRSNTTDNPLFSDPVVQRGVSAADVNRIQIALNFVKDKKYQRAINIITPMANSRNPDARYRLALMVKQGLGTKERPRFAFSLVKLAAEQGHPHARKLLSEFYTQGYGVKADAEEAAKWL